MNEENNISNNLEPSVTNPNNNVTPVVNNDVVAPVENVVPASEIPAVETAPVVEVAPVVNEIPVVETTPVVETAPVVEVAPVIETAPVVNATPVEVAPVAEVAPVMPETSAVVSETPVTVTPSENVTPVVTSEPAVVAPAPSVPSTNVPTNVNPMDVVQPQETKKKTPVGLIVGIAAGAVVLLVVILLLVLKPFGGGGGALSGPKGVVEKYVNNLIAKGYGDNFSLVSIPENHFVETSDYVEFVQKKSDYQGLDGFKIKNILELSLEETKGMYNVVLGNESEMTKNISINLENVNGWKVVEDNLFIKDWSIIVPKGTKVTIDDKEVPQTLLVDDATSTNTIKYNIPAITSTKKTVVLNNQLQSMTVEETPLAANSGKKYEMVLNNQELVDKAYAYIKDTWNQMYTSYVGKVNVSDIASKYFDSSVDINNVDVYYNQSLGKIADSSEKDFKILEVIGREGYSNYVLTDELIQLNFGYKLSWIYAPTYSSKETPREMTRYSKIILKYDGSSFKIYDVQDTKLFSYANYFTLDY